ncbi:MAG TPA: MltA domain-containing protein [Candidatus Cybelea sp.]|nr:MltA domain-containing protein [Candidatus Cybelea sp.]
MAERVLVRRAVHPAAWAAALLFLAGLGALLWWWLRPVPVPPDRLALQAARFADLPGWQDDRVDEAIPALLRTCARLKRNAPDHDFGLLGRVADWLPVCDRAAGLSQGDAAAARALFEQNFTPLAAANQSRADGLFTGYFEISLNGSAKASSKFSVPLYRRPGDLVTVDLGQFRDELRGQRIAGRVVDGQLKPYESRAQIDDGALKGKGLELLWVDDAIDAFFLEIQGSGRVKMEDGSTVSVGYAAQNGYPYVAIGRKLIELGAFPDGGASMQAIRTWLLAHADEAHKIMELNPSYVFFREIKGDGPLGAEGVALTPGRSLAVDHRFIPYGTPLWLDTSKPGAEGQPDVPLRRLMMAQDTGGAIRGPVRGDVFWGFGPEAAETAGHMKQSGRYWLLVPNAAAARLLPPE